MHFTIRTTSPLFWTDAPPIRGDEHLGWSYTRLEMRRLNVEETVRASSLTKKVDYHRTEDGQKNPVYHRVRPYCLVSLDVFVCVTPQTELCPGGLFISSTSQHSPYELRCIRCYSCSFHVSNR